MTEYGRMDARLLTAGCLNDDLVGLPSVGIGWMHYSDGVFIGSFWIELFRGVKSFFFEDALRGLFSVIVPVGVQPQYRQFSPFERRIPGCLCQTLIAWPLLPLVLMPLLPWQDLDL